MFSISAENIYDVIKPIHAYSQFIGLTAFTIRKNKSQKYEGFVTLLNVLCIIISSCWSLTIIFRLIFYETIWVLNQEYLSKFFENGSRIVLSFFMAIILFACWWLFLIKDKFVILLELIFDIDQSLMELGSPVNHLKQKKFLIFFLIFTRIMHISEAVGTFFMSKITKFYNVSFYSLMGNLIGSECFAMLFSQFIFLIWTLKIRYQHINNFLKKINSEEHRSHFENSSKIKKENLKTLQILHNKLIDVADMISFCYGVPVSKIYDFLNIKKNKFLFAFR